MPSSEQENAGATALLAHYASGGVGAKPAAPPPPFRFAPPRALIDWHALHALDLGGVVRETDVDALESVLDVVAFGDIEAEDYRTLTPANFIQVGRACTSQAGGSSGQAARGSGRESIRLSRGGLHAPRGPGGRRTARRYLHLPTQPQAHMPVPMWLSLASSEQVSLPPRTPCSYSAQHSSLSTTCCMCKTG